MRFVYPQSVQEPRMPDELFREEAQGMEAAGHSVHLVDTEALATGPARLRPSLESEAVVGYRGWMLTYDDYTTLATSVTQAGGRCFTSPDEYVATHYLPNWYAEVADYTPETVVLDPDGDVETELRHLGWKRFFVKDYVKSLKTSVGSIIDRPEQIELIVEEMKKFRGFIEGGLCIRRVEDFVAGSEQRYFVLNHVAFAAAPGVPIPEPVTYCASAIDSPFFSVDVARRSDGAERIVELGDGQVSDLVGWSVTRFIDIWRNMGDQVTI